MVQHLGAYQRDHPPPLATEARAEHTFRLGEPSAEPDTRSVTVAGRIDRLEPDPDGQGVKVVDYKTGVHLPTKAQAAANPQLGLYQLMVASGGVQSLGLEPPEVTGAELVCLAADGAKAKQFDQPSPDAWDSPDWVMELLERCHAHATSTKQLAISNDNCHHCPVTGCCPAQPAGEQVVA